MSIFTKHLLDVLLGLYVYTYPSEEFKIKLNIYRPYDFIVDEYVNSISSKVLFEDIAKKNIQNADECNAHCVYVIEKVGLDSLRVANYMCEKLRCRDFDLMGLKDASAITYQVVVLHNCKKVERELLINMGDAYAKAFLWFCTNTEPILVHTSNRFQIRIHLHDKNSMNHIINLLNIIEKNGGYILTFLVTKDLVVEDLLHISSVKAL